MVANSALVTFESLEAESIPEPLLEEFRASIGSLRSKLEETSLVPLVGPSTCKVMPDVFISASSSYSSSYVASESRLDSRSGWWPQDTKMKSGDQWLQWDFDALSTVVKVQTKGRNNNLFVKSFKLSYSLDGVRWSVYPTTLEGNIDGETVTENLLHPPIEAKHLRLHPESWGVGGIAVRAELLTIDPACHAAYRLCPRVDFSGIAELGALKDEFSKCERHTALGPIFASIVQKIKAMIVCTVITNVSSCAVKFRCDGGEEGGRNIFEGTLEPAETWHLKGQANAKISVWKMGSATAQVWTVDPFSDCRFQGDVPRPLAEMSEEVLSLAGVTATTLESVGNALYASDEAATREELLAMGTQEDIVAMALFINIARRDSAADQLVAVAEAQLMKHLVATELRRKEKASTSPGEYIIQFDNLPVNVGLDRESSQLTTLPIGSIVTVSEVAAGLHDGRVRGRLKDPGGYISMRQGDICFVRLLADQRRP